MATALRLIYTNCRSGQEAAFEAWYRTVHMPDILSVKGFVAGQLRKLSGVGPTMHTAEGPTVAQYLAVYEMDTADADLVMDRLHQASFRAQGRSFPGTRVVSRARYQPLNDQQHAAGT
jgi:hypothetical protein